MQQNFSLERGERVMIASTPRFPTEIDGHLPGYIEYEGRTMTRFDARRKYVEALLRPYRWPSTAGWTLSNNQALQIDNAEGFYPQDGKLAGYGVDKLIDYSDSSGPGRRAIHQYPSSHFTPDRVLAGVMSEMHSGTGASSEHTTLAMFIVSQPQFRDRIYDLLALSDDSLHPEILEGGQVHVVRLGVQEKFDALYKKVWVPNQHEQEKMIEALKNIPYNGRYETFILDDIFPGFNLWNLSDLHYPVYEWNQKNRKDGGYMEIQVNYKDISKSKLVIRSVKKEKPSTEGDALTYIVD